MSSFIINFAKETVSQLRACFLFSPATFEFHLHGLLLTSNFFHSALFNLLRIHGMYKTFFIFFFQSGFFFANQLNIGWAWKKKDMFMVFLLIHTCMSLWIRDVQRADFPQVMHTSYFLFSNSLIQCFTQYNYEICIFFWTQLKIN